MKALGVLRTSRALHLRPRRHGLTLLAVPAVVLSLLPALGFPGSASASVPAGYVEGVHVAPSLAGCRGSAGVSFPLLGPYVCPAAEYTSGNLGKGWNELDNVPHQLTTSLGTQSDATTDYNVIVAADNSETSAAGSPEGYDFISAPTVHAGSAASCSVSANAMDSQVGLTGGVYDGIYRVLTIHQAKGSTCVFDYYMRLSITSSDYSGSSLQGYMFLGSNFSTGKRTVPIPVKELAPQDFTNATVVTQGSAHAWTVLKSTNPGALNFGNTCLTGGANLTRNVDITVTWTKLAAAPAGNLTIVATVSAINPASRPITVNITNTILSGTTAITPLTGSPDVNPKSGSATVNPGTTLLFTQTIYAPAGTTNISSYGVATYSDPVPPYPAIPGTTTKTTTATTASGTTTDGSAVITDVESITGTGFSYKVVSVNSGSPSGTFTVPDGADAGTDPDAYTLGTATTAAVTWTSGTRAPAVGVSESITFTKTVLLDQARVSTGTLSDTAAATNGTSTLSSDTASVDLTSSASVSIPITKNIPNLLTGSETASFTFRVLKASDDTEVASQVISFVAGQTSKTETVTGLAPDVYYVTEDTATGWNPQSPSGNIDLSVQTDGTLACSGGVTFTNTFGPAVARAVKATTPAGSENGWSMCLTGPGTEGFTGGKECVTTAAVDTDLDPLTPDVNGIAGFTTALAEGSYTITEVMQTGWEAAGTPTGDCSFTVNYPANFDRLYTCSFSNRALGTVTVNKTVDGQLPAAGAYSFQVRTGASTTSAGTVVASDSNDATGVADFNPPQYFTAGTYQICEVNLPLNAGPTFSSGTVFVPTIANDSTVDNTTRCVQFVLTAGQSFSITIDNHTPGDGRTIGYWKNWSGSCNGGRQADSLGTYLGAGIAVGNLFVDQTCAEAVPILNKSDIVSGKKMASNPAYNMAAQFLAAKLNVAKGVATCTKVANTLVSAQALLVAVNFVGTGTPSMTKPQQTAANTYASILDNYNNNNTAAACT